MLRHNAVTPQEKVASLIALGAVTAAAVVAANSGAATSFGATAAHCLLQSTMQSVVEAWPDPGFAAAAARSFGFQDETRMYFGSTTVTLHFDGESIAERQPAPSPASPSPAAPSDAASSTDIRFDYLRDGAEPAIVWETVNGEQVVVEQNVLSTLVAENRRLQLEPREHLRSVRECANAGVFSPG